MELKTDCTDSFSASFLLQIPSRCTENVCGIPAVRWVSRSSTDESGILLSLRSTKRHSPNSSLRAENSLSLVSFQQPDLAVRTQAHKVLSAFWIILWAIPWLAKKGLQVKNCLHWYFWSDTLEFKYVCCSVSVFSARRGGPIALTFFTMLVYVELAGTLREVYECGIKKSITSALYDTISLLHSVRSVHKGFSVVLGCAGKPSQAVIPAFKWSGSMQVKLVDKCVNLTCCESAYLSEVGQSKVVLFPDNFVVNKMFCING